MHRFETLDDVQSALHKLMERQPPLVKILPRQPGTKESRYAHLLSGDVVVSEPTHVAAPAAAHHSGDSERITRLEEEIASLRAELADVKQQVEGFRKQFE